MGGIRGGVASRASLFISDTIEGSNSSPRTLSPLSLEFKFENLAHALSDSQIKGSQLHRSFADILKSNHPISSDAETRLSKVQLHLMAVLMEKIVALEAKLSFVRANLRLEESFSSSLLRTNLPDFAGKWRRCALTV